MNSTERFEDSPDLFGCGCGGSTDGEEVCEWCGKIWNEGLDGDEDDLLSGVFVRHTNFGGKNVCECCFDKIEDAIWRRKNYVAIWLRKRALKNIDEQKQLLLIMG